MSPNPEIEVGFNPVGPYLRPRALVTTDITDFIISGAPLSIAEAGLIIRALSTPDASDLLAIYQERASKAVLVSWLGVRIPTGLTINGREVISGRDGFLDDAEGETVATYIRVQDSTGGRESKNSMVVFIEAPKQHS